MLLLYPTTQTHQDATSASLQGACKSRTSALWRAPLVGASETECCCFIPPRRHTKTRRARPSRARVNRTRALSGGRRLSALVKRNAAALSHHADTPRRDERVPPGRV